MIEILNEIPFQLDPAVIIKSLRLRTFQPNIEKIVGELVRDIQPIAKPKAVYKVSYIDNKTTDSLEIDGVKFTSRVLRANLDRVERVFPYVVTGGIEIAGYKKAQDLMTNFCIDAIKVHIIGVAANYLLQHVTKKYALGQASSMNPGSLKDWPLTQQKQLFSLLGDTVAAIGVRLSDSGVIYPLKSISGIYFPTEVKFESCQLCQRERCMGRRAAYSPELAEKYK
ncbi:MAG: hypothetical protein JW967_06455 [Dehalococcoidales bacterium]|nr:hypothetical protein [Dehalococcoidales bacterium]